MPVHAWVHRPLRELARRAGDGLEVALFWRPVTNDVVVCVTDHTRGAYFEIEPAPELALDAFHHPYSYVDSSSVHYEDERLAA